MYKSSGKWESYYEGGKQLHSKGTFVEGDLDGLWQVWYPNGKLSIRDIYEKREQLERTDWDYEGNIRSRTVYGTNCINTLIKWDKKGGIISSNIVDGHYL